MTFQRRDAIRCLALGAIAAGCGGARAQSGHPADDYRMAAQLFTAGRRDEATYLFYLGQFRFRVYLLARPNLPPSGDRALFASLSESVGRPINEWAYGDVPRLVSTLDRVIAAAASRDDPYTPRAQFPAAHAEALAGLQRLRSQTLAQRAFIHQQRERNGLPNRE